ncbi:hypothetical protein, variant 2 [Aphanomyces astaci]|nr:hypothetical protein, variant 2 [Aphanomyces astaci]ETV67041.1 hypothetical protein, variant 2 [Aphanomyces astaci]|eukprot:XP_009843415.1 hypothetical protein, variant 2 [Aphanomyces astaci]
MYVVHPAPSTAYIGARNECVYMALYSYTHRRLLHLHLRARRKYALKAGLPLYEHAATTIQKLVRGRQSRRHLQQRGRHVLEKRNVYGKPQWWVLDDVVTSQVRLARLQRRRDEYQALVQQLRCDEQAKKMALDRFRALEAMLTLSPPDQPIQTDLVDGYPSAYAHDVVQRFLAQHLPKSRANLSAAETELRLATQSHPLLHQAATIISARYRVMQCKIPFLQHRNAVRATEIRFKRSKAESLVRMNVAMHQRAVLRIHGAATTISSWWKMVAAVALGISLRKRRAHFKLNVLLAIVMTMLPKAKAARRRHLVATVVVRYRAVVSTRLVTKVVAAWKGYAKEEVALGMQRRAREERGMLCFIESCVRRLQRSVKHFLHTTRPNYTRAVVSGLHPVVALHLEQCQGDLAILARAVESDVQGWLGAEDFSLWVHLANEYCLPLALLEPVDAWWPRALELLRLHVQSSDRQPWRVCVLAFLDDVSPHYAAMDAMGTQLLHIEAKHELVCVARSYLVHLCATHHVAMHPNRAVLAGQELAKQWQQDLAIRRHLHASPNTTTEAAIACYSRFHSDNGPSPLLCSNCFVMFEYDLHPSQCPCGFAYIRRPTTCTYVQPVPLHNNEMVVRFPHAERSDLLLVHAYFHALAPLGHANRLQSPPHLWRLAVTRALPWIEVLSSHNLHTLDALCQLPRKLVENTVNLPVRVHAHLVAMVAELTRQWQELIEMEAASAGSGFGPQR